MHARALIYFLLEEVDCDVSILKTLQASYKHMVEEQNNQRLPMNILQSLLKRLIHID